MRGIAGPGRFLFAQATRMDEFLRAIAEALRSGGAPGAESRWHAAPQCGTGPRRARPNGRKAPAMPPRRTGAARCGCLRAQT